MRRKQTVTVVRLPQKKDTPNPWKDYLVILPVIGTVSAVTFDVGYFYGIDINLFTLFSLSEHVLFSIEALPWTFAIVLVAPTFFATDFIPNMGRWFNENKRWRRVSKSVMLLLWILIGFLGFKFPATQIPLATAITIMAALGAYIAGPLDKPPLKYLAGAFVVIACIFLLGYTLANLYVDGEKMHTIETANTKIDGRIIRSGERGMLFVDTQKKILFLKWSEITRVSVLNPPPLLHFR
jgi:hypothetical protein